MDAVDMVRAAPMPTPDLSGCVTCRPAYVGVPLVEVHWKGQWRRVVAASVSRRIQSAGPDQVPSGTRMTAATGSFTLTQGRTVSRYGWDPLTLPMPVPGESVRLRGSMDAGDTWHNLFSGKVSEAGGRITSRGLEVGIIERTDLLARPVTHPPLNFRQPNPADGKSSRQIGLHPIYFANFVARRSGWLSTPPMSGDRSFVSAPMVGSMWPERGVVEQSEVLVPKETDTIVAADSPDFVDTWWGLTCHNVHAVYRPTFPGGRLGLIGQDGIEVRLLVGPTGARSSSVDVFWGIRHCLSIAVTSTSVVVRTQTDADTPGGRTTLQERERTLTAGQRTKGFELRVWLGEQGTLVTHVDGERLDIPRFSSLPPAFRGTTLHSVQVTAHPDGAPVGGVVVEAARSPDDSPGWGPSFLIHADARQMLTGAPALVARDGLALLQEMAGALLGTVFLDEDGRLQYWDRSKIDSRPASVGILAEDCADAEFSLALGSVHTSVEGVSSRPYLTHPRVSSRASLRVWEGPQDVLGPGDTSEEIVTVPDGEDWFNVDLTFTPVSEATIDEVNRGFGSVVGGTLVETGADGKLVERAARPSWYSAEAEMITWDTFKITFKNTTPPDVAGDISFTIPDLGYAGLWRSHIGTGPRLRARGRQTWGERRTGPVVTGADLDAEAPHEHDAGWWIQSDAVMNRTVARVVQMVSAPVPAWRAVRMGAPDLSIRLGDTVGFTVRDRLKGQRVSGIDLEFDADTGVTQTLAFRQINR